MTKKNEHEEEELDKKTSYDEGCLVNLSTRTGYREFGYVLKVITFEELKEFDPSIPDELNYDFQVLGTYHQGEVARMVAFNEQDRPPLYLMAARIVSDEGSELIAHDTVIPDDVKPRLYKDLQTIAKKDETIGDRVNELFRLSLNACMTRELALSASEQMKKTAEEYQKELEAEQT